MSRFTLIFAALALMLTGLAAAKAEPRDRIETGEDLYKSCSRALVEEEAGPDVRLSGPALLCRKFIDGYFNSLRALKEFRPGRALKTLDLTDQSICINVPDVASYPQLERRVVQYAEWHPELLSEPAVLLVQRTFTTEPPC